jgi:hypothetical protein
MLLAKFDKDGSGPASYNCWNFCREVAKRGNRIFPVFSGWVEELSIRNKTMCEFLESDFLGLTKPEPFCIVTIRLVPKFINHCGIVLEDSKHFTQIRRIGPSIERLDDSKWVKRIEGFYRYVKHSENK